MKTNGVDAWVLTIGQEINIAVGQFELVHIINRPEYLHVPQAPEYCKQVIIWNNNIVPVINLSSLFLDTNQQDACVAVAILMYENDQGNLVYGGIKLMGIPVMEKVFNEQQCKTPSALLKMENMSVSSYMSKTGVITPILNVSSIFS